MQEKMKNYSTDVQQDHHFAILEHVITNSMAIAMTYKKHIQLNRVPPVAY